MSSIFESFRNIFGYKHYEAMEKKDDDLSINQVSAWIESYPVNERTATLDATGLQEYALDVIRSLGLILISPSNVDVMGCHLSQIATQSDALRKCLMKNIDKLKASQEIKNSLKRHLIFTCPQKA